MFFVVPVLPSQQVTNDTDVKALLCVSPFNPILYGLTGRVPSPIVLNRSTLSRPRNRTEMESDAFCPE